MGFSDARLAVLARHERSRGRDARGTRSTCIPCLQAHRHLRRRIRLAHRLYVFDLRAAVRPASRNAKRGRRTRDKIIILGGGPNRIGQGIEFDYCCCHACFRAHEAGFETIMINCNPETVSTDYDTSDRLYFEPLTAEDVLEIMRMEQANGTLHGVIVQFGGQTPLKLAEALRGGRRADPRHLARCHRSCRGPRPLQAPARQARPEAAEERHRLFGRAERAWSRPISAFRSWCARPMCWVDAPWRSSMTSALRRLSARHLAGPGAGGHQGALSERQDRPDQHAARQEPSALRPLSQRRDRGRCRLRSPTARRRIRRRHHGAYRGSGHPFRRFGLLAAAPFARSRDRRRAGGARRRSSRSRSTSAA